MAVAAAAAAATAVTVDGNDPQSHLLETALGLAFYWFGPFETKCLYVTWANLDFEIQQSTAVTGGYHN